MYPFAAHIPKFCNDRGLGQGENRGWLLKPSVSRESQKPCQCRHHLPPFLICFTRILVTRARVHTRIQALCHGDSHLPQQACVNPDSTSLQEDVSMARVSATPNDDELMTYCKTNTSLCITPKPVSEESHSKQTVTDNGLGNKTKQKQKRPNTECSNFVTDFFFLKRNKQSELSFPYHLERSQGTQRGCSPLFCGNLSSLQSFPKEG